MTRNTIARGFLLLGLMTLAVPVFAHHSFQAEYDGSKFIYVSGTLTKVDWSNPHIHFFVSVKSTDGTTTLWNFEGSATTLVERNGTHRVDLLSSIGKEVTVRAAPARAIPTRGAAETVKTADGVERVVGGRRYSGEAGNN
jgi:WD40 repeat protein